VDCLGGLSTRLKRGKLAINRRKFRTKLKGIAAEPRLSWLLERAEGGENLKSTKEECE